MIDANAIVARLGIAQKRVILSLGEDWGPASCHQTAKRMFWGVGEGRVCLVEHKHRTDNCWALNSNGMAVRAVLASQAA